MEKICLMVDSAGDLTKSMAEEYDIRVLPFMITYGGCEHREFYDIDVAEYWDYLEQHEELPTTAQITPTQYLEAFASARADGYQKLIVVTINGNGSGTYGSGVIARDLYYAEHGRDMEIALIDSKNYTIAYGKAMILAREAICAGASFSDVVALIEDHVSRVEAAAAVFSLRQLRRSGRINGAAACVGELLGIKPLIHLCNGEVNVVDKVRGEKTLVQKLCDFVDARIDQHAPQERALHIIYSKVPEEYIYLVETHLREKYGFSHVPRIPFGCSVSTNTGPNILGIVYYGEKRA